MAKVSTNGEVPNTRSPLFPHFTYHRRRVHGLRRIGLDKISVVISILHIADWRRQWIRINLGKIMVAIAIFHITGHRWNQCLRISRSVLSQDASLG